MDRYIRDVAFELERVVAEGILAEDMNLYRTNVYRREMAKGLVMSIIRYLPSIGLDEVRYPTTWWDAFKERWFPKWALRRWPTNWTVKKGAALFPELQRKIPVPNIEESFGSFRIAYLD